MDKDRESRKREVVELGDLLDVIGGTRALVAAKLGRNPATLWKWFSINRPNCVPSRETLQKLKEHVVQVAKDKVQQLLQRLNLSVTQMQTCNEPGAQVTNGTKQLLLSGVLSSLASVVSGKPEVIPWPSGITGVLVPVGSQLQPIYLMATRPTGGTIDEKALAHEYRELATYLRAEAGRLLRSLKGRSPRRKLPRKGF